MELSQQLAVQRAPRPAAIDRAASGRLSREDDSKRKWGANKFEAKTARFDNGKGKGKGKKHSTPQGRHICFKFANGEDCDGSCGRVHCCQFCFSTNHSNAGHQEGSHLP